MGFRRDLNRPSSLGQLALIGCSSVIIGLFGVAGVIGTDTTTRWIGGGIVVLGLMVIAIAVRRLGRQAPARREPERWDRPWDR